MGSEAATGNQLDPEQLRQTVRFLYEGRCDGPRADLARDCEFRDPLVIVRGSDRVVSMFQKLNRMYPATSVASFAPLPGNASQYALSVQYRRKADGKATIFESEIEFLCDRGEIIQITEDWKRPMKLSGRGTHLVSRWCRGGLGRIFS